MGIIRLLLALAVVYGHAAGGGIIPPYTPALGYFPLDAVTAVQMFFVISGFYMGLVLTEKYRALDGWVWKFYLNRYSRLMPSYLIVVALTSWFLSPQLFVLAYDTWQNIVFGFSTLTLFGIELTVFYDVAYRTGTYPAHGQLLVQQAWSLGVELWFYLCVPLIVLLSTRTLIAASAGLLALRVGVSWIDPIGFPWLQRIWPLELYFFLLGILAYRAYAASGLKESPARRFPECMLAFAAVAGLVMFAGHIRGMQAWKPDHVLLATAGFAAALPLIFALTRNSEIDRWIGEFSYPVYLVHLLVMNVMPGGRSGLWAYLALTLLAAAPLVVLVEIPLDWWRQRFFRSRPEPITEIAARSAAP
jgi:peptidoglycan/LPS O-acetylase OafA/YrhL